MTAIIKNNVEAAITITMVELKLFPSPTFNFMMDIDVVDVRGGIDADGRSMV